MLRRRGHEVVFADAAVGDVGFGSVRCLAARFVPDVALLSVSAPTRVSDLEVAARIRGASPDCRIGVLGVHPTVEPEQYLSPKAGVDFVIRGEPDVTAQEVVESLTREGPLAPLSGLSVRRADLVLHGPDRPPIDLRDVGLPDWSLLRRHRYRLPLVRRRYLPVLTSRGCPYHCTFCTQHLYYGRTVRRRPPEQIAAEVQGLQTAFGVRDFFLWSECFSADRAHALAVCGELSGIPGIAWVATTRVDCVDPELLQAMRRAGCWLIALGIESGSQAILDRVHKQHTVVDSVRAVRWAREAGLFVVGHFIFGLPGEDDETAQATLDLALELPLNFAQFYCAAPYPGTALGEQWRKKEGAPSAFPPRQDRACMATAALTTREIERWRRRGTRRFYCRPGRLAELVRLAMTGFGLPSPPLQTRPACAPAGEPVVSSAVRPTPRVLAIIATLNEEPTVGEVVRAVKPYVTEIVVVDGGSTDETRRRAREAGARVIALGIRGKGLAIKWALANEIADSFVLVDADGSHAPDDVPQLLAPLLRDEADLVIGSRLAGGSDEFDSAWGHLPRLWGTRLIQAAVNWRFGTRLTDIQNGFRAISARLARQLPLRQAGFCIEQEMTLQALRAGHRVINVPSHEFCRRYGRSRLRLWAVWPSFAWTAVGLLLAPRLSPSPWMHLQKPDE
jgi:radical SAM superfamily enzyme YgiQ (UPF0313 family)